MAPKRPPMKNFKAGSRQEKLTRELKTVQMAMAQRQSNAVAMQQALQVLVDRAYLKPDHQMLIGRMGLLEDIQAVMQWHPDDSAVQEIACRAIAAVAVHPLNTSKPLKLGLFQEIRNAMVAHPASVPVQEAACRAVSVCSSTAKARDCARSLKLLQAVQCALKKHMLSITVIEEAAFAVSNIVNEDPSNQALAVKLRVPEDLRAAMAAHQTADKLVKRCAIALERCSREIPPEAEPISGQEASQGPLTDSSQEEGAEEGSDAAQTYS
eukprot:CAMPEP_0117649730 /NCGR_PEP_ID=MMETSP0804-20121206/1143_1 /TAXON_ID=1074897 /ORGANISM="Tetraselmis astigmatica, Strain CCMP880" /LENGTH=266 /DNA_ID=CAMNT_0005455517 /DNA_START=296 /DNA_END=1093 /DNA_ORIENTATION=-